MLLDEGWYLLCVVCELELWVCWVVLGWEIELILVVDLVFLIWLFGLDIVVF